MSDFAYVIDWNSMTWKVDFDSLEEHENDTSNHKCDI